MRSKQFACRAAAGAIFALGVLAFAQIETAEMDFENGVGYFKAKEFGKAMDRFTHALLLDPGNPSVHNYIALTQQELEKSQAQEGVNPAELQDMVRRAQSVLQARRSQAAKTLGDLKIAYDESELKDPTAYLEACRGIDIVLDVSLGDDSESRLIKHYVKSICSNLEKNVAGKIELDALRIRKIRGYLAYCRGEWSKAVTEWTIAFKDAPKDAHLRKLLERAKEQLAKAAAKQKIVDMMENGDAALSSKRFSMAMDIFENVLSMDPYNKGALDHLKLARLNAERSELVAVSKWAQLARERQNHGDILTAARYWFNILEVDPLSDDARRNLAKNKVELTKELQSVLAKSGTLEISPTQRDSEAHRLYTLGLIQYSEGNLAASEASLRKAGDLSPSDEYIRNALKRVINELSIKR